MAEAVFSISADITPELDDRELERQAQSIAKQLNGILAKQVDKVNVAPAQGSFRPFQQEVIKATNILDRFHQTASKLPITKIAKEGSNAFLKFTDVLDITRRDIVGYGDSLFDSIRNTHRFRSALDEIKASGSALSDLPKRFQTLSAQIQSGTSVVDRFAAKGNQLAQFFQPVLRVGEASRVEFVDMNASLDRVVRSVNQLASASGKVDATRNDFDLLGKTVNDLEKPFFRVQAILNDAGLSTSKFGKEARATFAGAAGDPKQLAEALVLLRDKAQLVAGPLGFINQKIGELSAAERDAAKAARLELNVSLIELGHGDQVKGIQKISAEFAIMREKVEAAVKIFELARTGLAKILPGSSPIGKFVDSIADAANNFKIFRSVGIGSLDAIRASAGLAFDKFKESTGLDEGIKVFKAMDNAATQLVSTIGGKLKSAFGDLLVSFQGNKFGQIFNNLVVSAVGAGTGIQDGLVRGIKRTAKAFQSAGTSIAEGLSVGIESGRSALTKATTTIYNTVLGGIKKLFGIHSPAESTKPPGRDISAGLAEGITEGKGQVNNALKGLTDGLSALKNSASQFAKSITTVAAVAFGGLAGAALHAGIEFNTLQQVVHGTLPVLVGSAKASDELLASVNELNQTSPFARASFLQLTQTLAGFGVQAKKIPGLIDAIQQTVAATGGSEADLQELGGAFARIQSQGRLSLDVLQSFSSRGVDAIGILGKSFGKTQAEIRDMISNGLVPADKAIDALTQGLQEKFNGATEAVAKNLPGALDRVHAKLRDLGAELTRAFVNPEGGGALVDFLNHISNAIKHITVDILPTLRPLLDLVAVAFANIGAKVEAFSKAISASAVPHFVDQMSTLAPVLAGLLGFFPKLLGFIPGIGPLLSGLGGPFTAFALILGVVAARSQSVRDALAPVITNFQNLAAVVAPIIQNILPKLEDLFGRVVAAIAPFIAKVEAEAVPFINQLGDVLSDLVTDLGPVVDAFGRLLTSLDPAIFFSFLTNLLQIGKAFGPISTAVASLLNFLSRFGSVITGIITAFVGLKIAGVIINLITGTLNTMKAGLLAAAEGAGIFGGALEALGISAGIASSALNIILGPVGIILTGIALFKAFKGSTDSASASIQKLGDASLDADGKFKALFNTKDLNKFKESIVDLKGEIDKINNTPAKSNEEVLQQAQDIDNLKKKIKDQEKAVVSAREAGTKGFGAQAAQAILANRGLDQNVTLRNQLLSAINEGITAQARESILNEQNSETLDKAKAKLKELADAHKDVHQVAVDSAKAIADNYSAASKIVEDAQTKMSGAIDSLKQGLSTIDQKLSPLFSAAAAIKTTAKAVVDAKQGLTDAQQKQSDDTISFTRLLKDQKKAFEDVIKPVDELAVAQRNLTRIQNSLRDSQRQIDELAKERAKLTGQEAADDRAGLARSEERATIALNKAKQAQLDLENELNNAGKISINLSGLSLDQIRAKLAAARLSSNHDRKQTAQEKADARTTAALDVADATQGVTDAKAASLQFEIDTKNRIRDIDEQTLSIQADMADKRLEEQTAQLGINRLREGDNALAALTLDWQEKIRDATRQTATDARAVQTATEAVKTATDASRLAGIELQLQSATIRGNTKDIATFQQQIWNEKQTGLTWDAKTQTAVDTLKGSVSSLLKDYQNITAEVQKALKLQATASTLQGVGSSLGNFESTQQTFDRAVAEGNDPLAIKLIPKMDKIKSDLFAQIRTALNSGAAENKQTKEPWLPSGNQVENIIRDINARSTKESLRDAIRDALNNNSPPLSMPGFAAARGLSPGMIHRGMHDGKGLVRMFEFGKEAVLPLTRPADMARIVGDPSVLPAIMKALPGFASGFAPGDILSNVLTSTNSKLRAMLEQIYKALGLQFPGFAEGYAPGDTISTSSMGSFSMPNSSSALSPLLNGLPRWSRPTTSLATPAASTDLATVVRTARNSGGPANADVYAKKDQREFAGTIGEAVKAAMTEAIGSGNLGGGNHADIHVNPNASETQRAIAREVKRQLDKRTGKW